MVTSSLIFAEKNINQLLYLTQDESTIESYDFDFSEREKRVPAQFTEEGRWRIRIFNSKSFTYYITLLL
jgi:hypothetical protein